MSALVLTALPNIPMIAVGDDLAAIIVAALRNADLALARGDVLVLAQKIVSKAEGRLVDLTTITPSPQAVALAEETGKDARVVELILEESTEVLRRRPGVLIVAHKLGLVLANAGIEVSGRMPLHGPINSDNRRYLTAKATRAGHQLEHILDAVGATAAASPSSREP